MKMIHKFGITMAAAVLLLAPAAFAQNLREAVVINPRQAVSVGSLSLAAGTYKVERFKDNVLSIRSAESGKFVGFVLATAAGENHGAAASVDLADGAEIRSIYFPAEQLTFYISAPAKTVVAERVAAMAAGSK